ncbi:MAG: hypothetical protein Q9217_003648 [Psora testacea]
MLNAANPPPIPERTSARISLSSPKGRKRRSLPASPQHELRPTQNSVVVKPASPEVITSLIETLAAISSPADHHFDSFHNISASHSTPASPNAWDTRFPRSGSGARALPSPLRPSLGMEDDRVAGPTPRSHGSHLLPEHANGTPIGRSSPRRKPSERSLAQASREAAYDDLLDDAYSIGNLSIEPGVAADSTQRQPNQKRSLKSLRSVRSFKALAAKSSRDSLPKSEICIHAMSKKESEPKHEQFFIANSRSPSPSPRDLTVNKREPPAYAFNILHSTDDTLSVQPSTTSMKPYLDSEDASSSGPSQSKRSSYAFPHQDHIPTRNSSRRQGSIFANRKQRSRPALSEHSVAPESEAETGDEQFHTPPSTPPPTIAELDEVTVKRRIEELKEQKAKRDRLSTEAASDAPSLPVRTNRSPSPSPLPTDQTTSEQTTVLGVPNGVLERSTLQKESEETAPSPTVPQRIQRSNDSRASSGSGRPLFIRHSPTTSTGDTSGAPGRVPQRTDSKLLKRLSQASTSPAPAEKSRRRFSNPLGHTPVNRNTSYQPDSGDSVHDAVGDYLLSPRLSQKVAHPQTGRVISFSEVGDPEGSVVFCCVGMGLTRYITAFYDELATTLKLRLITPDRPGVGDSEPHVDGKDTPLGWPDDIRTICEHRGITKFSVMAHSAGAIYALATALRMPQHIRCRVHLLAPWIPPSQMSAMGTQQEPLPATAMPYSQRFLRSLPTTFLRAANSSFLSITSNSITTSLPRSPRRSKRSMSRSNTPTHVDLLPASHTNSPSARTKPCDQTRDKENGPPLSDRNPNALMDMATELQPKSEGPTDKEARRATYESRLASSIWDAATTKANPSVDLLVCLERKQPIGFRYVDITRAVVIHHGSKDSRVPVENVKWLGKMMRRCEVRVLEGEGHGLMASAGVMSNVLMEVAGEWGDWNRVVQGGKKGVRLGAQGERSNATNTP